MSNTERVNAERRMPNRREFLAVGMGAFLVAAVPLARRRPATLVRRTVPAMGTVAELAVAHGEPRYAHAAIDAAAHELRRVELLMTRFNTASDVGRANALPAGTRVDVAPETIDVLLEALHWAEASDGAFDPCLARATELWSVPQRRTPPAAGELRRFAGRRLYRSLDISRARDGGSIVLGDAEAALDLGGIAKGYGVDRAALVLREWGIASALVNVGGDLHVIGASPDGEPWRVGVRSPDHAGAIAATLSIADSAVATSGDYEQGFVHAGRRYHHLLDPASGEPRATEARSLTIAAPSCMVADAAATTLFGAADRTVARVLRAAARGAAVVHRI